MATTQAAAAERTLQELAKRHLWMHFSRMGAYDDGAEIPIIVARRRLLRLGRARATATSTGSARCSA